MNILSCFGNMISDNIDSNINKYKYKINKTINNNTVKSKGNYLTIYFNRFRLNKNDLGKENIILDDLIKKPFDRKRYKYNLINIEYINYKLINNLKLNDKFFHYPKFIVNLGDKNKIYFCYNKNHFIIKNSKLDLRGKRELFIKNIIETIEYLYNKNIKILNLDLNDFIYDKKDNRFKIWRIYKKDIELVKSPECYLKNYEAIKSKVWDKEYIWQLGLMIFKIYNFDMIQINNIIEYLENICIERKSFNYLNKKFNDEDIKYLVKSNIFNFCNIKLYKPLINNDNLLDLLFNQILVYDYDKRFNIKQVKNSLYYKSL